MLTFLRRCAIVSTLVSWAVIQPLAAQVVGTALTNNGPTVQGTIDGNVQQMTGTLANINGSGAITGDLLVPGTPTFVKNGSPTFGGIIVGTGNTSPSNYQVILNGNGARLGHLRTRTNPTALPTVPTVPSPTGTRTVTITAAGQSVGNFSTLKNLTLNGNVGQYTIPAGTYGDFIANGGSGFTLGVSGATQPSVYNLQHLTLNGATNIVVLGPVVINVANGFTANGAAGTSSNPAWLKINIVTGGFTVNGGCTLYSYVTLPAGTLTINGNAKLTGGAISKDLTINFNGLLKLFDIAGFENHPPVAANQSVTTAQDTAKPIVLSATDADGQSLTYSIVSQPAHGSLSGTAPNVTYTPTHGYFGADSFTFKANDGQADSNVATVSITVTHVNHPPTANAQTISLNQDTSKPVALTGSDPDNDPLTFRVTANPGHGTLSGTPPNLTYTPAPNFCGTDSFAFVANDGAIDSAPASVSITVNHVNHPPVANGQNVQTNEDTALSILLSATDIDSDPLTYTVLSSPGHGILSGTAPNLIYTPTAHFHGTDSFTFKANDGGANSNTATVQINVVHVNHPPTANGQNISLDEDTTAAITLTGSDPDGDTITFSISVQPQHGTLSGTPPNVVYAPAPDYFGSDSFVFHTNDGTTNSQDGIVNLTVRSVNDPPTVQISTPTNGAQFDAGDSVHISASAADKDGTIATLRILFDGVQIFEGHQATAAYDLIDVPAGNHTLTAVAIDNDGASTTSAAVTINVQSQGNGPVQVNAGPDRLISLPSSAHLLGSVMVNGAPAGSNVQIAWQKISGPGNATFDNAASLAPTVSFDAPGDYVLKLVATAPEGRGFDTAKVTVLSSPQAGPDSPVSNQGREFWMAFLGQHVGSEPARAGANLVISSEVAASGTVESSDVVKIDGAWQVYRQVQNFSVAAGQKTIVQIAIGFPPQYTGENDQALPTAIHIQANNPVSVHALNYQDATTDGALILPTGLLGLDHFVMSYTNGVASNAPIGSELAVVATKPQTQVTITPTAATATHAIGQAFTVTLQPGEVYRMLSNSDALGDFTGTRVQSDKPIAVFGGSTLAYVPVSAPAGDHLYEQMPSVDQWGRRFAALPFKGRTAGDRFRVLAANDNTRVSINGEIVSILNRGQFYETVLTQPSSVVADQRILLAQFAQGTTVDNTTGDPFMMVVPPYEAFGRHYILSTAQVYTQAHYTDVYDSYVAIIVDSAHTNAVIMNGQPIAANQFVPIGDSGFSGANISVPKSSTIDLSSPTPMGTWIYGWAPFESYGFTGGLYSELDAGTTQFTLTQSSSSAPIGSTHRVRAQLTNSSNLPVPGAQINFVVTGVNPTSGSAVTAPDGSAEFSWTGSQAGADTVTATSGAFSANISVTWLANANNQPPIVNAGPDVLARFGDTVTLNGLVQDDGLPAGGQLTSQWSVEPGNGDFVTFANPNSARTTATFAAPGQYVLRLTGFDGQFSGDDDLIVRIDAPPQFELFAPSATTVDAGGQWSVDVIGTDADGLVAKVELLDGSQVVASVQPNQTRTSRLTLSTTLATVGPHTMTARLTDDLGITTDQSIVVNARPAPVVQILTPATNVTIAAGDSVTFTASASSQGGAITQLIYQDVTGYPFEIGEGAGSNYSFTWTPSYSGTFQIAATAYDSAGAAGTSASVSITVQSPGDPTVTITSPANGSSIYLGQSATFHADASAVSPAQVSEVDFFDKGRFIGAKFSPPYELNWFPGNDGAHTLEADVYDTFGGYAATSITVNVTLPPDLTVTLVQPPPNIPVKVNAPTTLAATVDGVIGSLDGVQFYVNGQLVGDGVSESATWTPTAVGDYQIEVDASSSSPNQFGYVVTTVSVADLHSPVVQWAAPADRSSFAPGTPIGLQAQASDADGNLSKMQFFADGQLLSETGISGNAGVASFSWNNAGPGWHTLTALAADDTLQSGGALLRVFVQRTVANDLPGPTGLTAAPTSSSVTLNWTIPASLDNVTGYAIERKLGRQGTWQEAGAIDTEDSAYEDTTVDSETYYVYRVAALSQTGAISAYSNEATAITRAKVSQYVLLDLGDDLEQSGITAAFPSGTKQSKMAVKQSVASGQITPPPIDVGASRAMSISDQGEILLAGVDSSGAQVPGTYVIWQSNGQSVSRHEDKFKAVRITKDGTIVGSIDKTRDHSGTTISETHGVYWPSSAWNNASTHPTDITPTPEAYAVAKFPEDVDVDWLLTNLNADSSRTWWTAGDPNAIGKFPWELVWRSRLADRNRNGVMAGEATIVRQSLRWSQWKSLAVSDPNQATASAPFTDAGSSLLWPNGAQMPPQWTYLFNGGTIAAEATAFALNDNGVGVGVTAFNTGAPDYVSRFGDNLDRSHAFRSSGAQGGQQFDDLGTLGDGRFSGALEINNSGIAVGYSTIHKADEANRTQAAVWEANATNPTQLPTLLGSNNSYPDGFGYASSISDKGQIVGQSLAINFGDDAAQVPAITAAALWIKNAANDPTVPAALQSPQWEVADLNTQIDAFTTEDMGNGQMITYRRWYLDNAVGVNKDGWIVGTGVRTHYDSQTNSLISESRSFLLLPLELKDVKGSGDADDVVIETAVQAQQNPSAASIAWIEPHLGEDDSPQMPQLEARFTGAMNVEWKLEVKYDRGNGARTARNQSEDTVAIPTNGFVSLSTTQPWVIYQENAWTNQISNNGFFGGAATLTVRPQGQREQKFYFRISGKNADNTLARHFIDAQAISEEWFSYAIAKEETAEYRHPGGFYYNQFTSDRRSFWKNWPLGSPTWNDDGGDAPGGYGIFQITGTPTDQNADIPRRQIWNWQDNVHAYFGILRDTSKRGLARRHADKRRALNPAVYDQAPAPNNVIVYGAHSFPSNEAVWITAYNGWGQNITDSNVRYIFGPSAPVVPAQILNSANSFGFGSRWYWNPPTKSSGKKYLELVEQEIE
jgi:hypothetical protein